MLELVSYFSDWLLKFYGRIGSVRRDDDIVHFTCARFERYRFDISDKLLFVRLFAGNDDSPRTIAVQRIPNDFVLLDFKANVLQCRSRIIFCDTILLCDEDFLKNPFVDFNVVHF